MDPEAQSHELDAGSLPDAHSPRRGRLVAPLLVAAVLAGVAVAVAFATGAGHHAHPPGSIATGPEAATPVRPRWSFIRGTITSIDVTVVRKSFDADLAAPTVRRTLTGDPARRLAELLDSLPAQRPAECHSAGPWDAHTTLLFHSARRRLIVGIALNCMNQAGIGMPGNRHAFTHVAGDTLSTAALHALGLPPDYGFGTR